MNNINIIYISEPRLTYGYNQKLEDPRDGLTLFGPFTREKHLGQINIGIIGPQEQRSYVINYLKKIHQPVKNLKSDIARPYFPGLEAAFNIAINFNSIQEIDIPRPEIDECLKYSDGHERVFRLTELYVKMLQKYASEEHSSVDVWFIAIPDEIYLYGKPKSSIPSSSENKKTTLSKADRYSGQGQLFDEEKEMQKAYEFEVNFHNQLKAKLLNDKIITQIIRESTVAYETLWDKPEKKEKERIFDSAKAWNISTALYYKSGGIPWKLGDIREKVCYLGLVYKKIEFDKNEKNACCAAQMFLDSGDGMVFRGNIGPWYNPHTKEFHLSEKDAFELLSQSLESFREKSEDNKYPEEIFIHATTFFNDKEWNGFSEAAKNKSNIVGVRIRNDATFKLYRDFSYCVPRGTALLLSDSSAFLWTKGYIPRLQTQLGLETPNPLSIEITRGKKDIETVCKDILALTKLNYNACIFADGLPVTLRFADRIGEVLTAGKDIKSGVLSFKHYL